MCSSCPFQNKNRSDAHLKVADSPGSLAIAPAGSTVARIVSRSHRKRFLGAPAAAYPGIDLQGVAGSAQRATGGVTRVRVAQPSREVPLDLPIEVVPQLLIELGVSNRAADECAQTGGESSHRRSTIHMFLLDVNRRLMNSELSWFSFELSSSS